MTSSRSSNATRFFLAFLVLWFFVSLIVIVVWATSPDMKGASQCRSELYSLQEQVEKDRLIWTKDKHALEAMVWQGRANQSLLHNHTRHIQEQVRLLNESLKSCQQENTVLYANITLLENEIESLNAIKDNLTAQVSQQQDIIELEQHNLTQTSSKLKTCMGFQEAAQILKQTAETETAACLSSKVFLQKQLSKCKDPSQTSSPRGDGPPGPCSGIALFILISFSLFLTP